MKWNEIKVVTTRDFADIVSLFLIDSGSEGTVIVDSSDICELKNSGIIWDYIDDTLIKNNDCRVFVSGFFAVDADISQIIEELSILGKNSDIDIGAYEVSTTKIDSAEWENEWKKYYMPIEFSRFAIVPSWTKEHGILDKKIIWLNPGMAFGTGSHETTSMCLRLLDEISLDNKTVIDIGCGSGILGITAAKLGAANCFLTDIDPYAIKCANENLAINNLYKNIKVLEADLLNGELGEKADVITSNLTAPLLLAAKNGIVGHLKTGGIAIISGILKDYNSEVLDAYSQDFEITQSLTNGDWCAHLLTLKNK